MDLCGPMEHVSLCLFMLLTLVDDFNRLTSVFFLQKKSEAFHASMSG